jgi:hypothetical protein
MEIKIMLAGLPILKNESKYGESGSENVIES